MLESERQRRDRDERNRARGGLPRTDPAPSILVGVQPLANPPPGGRTNPRVHRASQLRSLVSSTPPAATDFPVTVIGEPIVTDLDLHGPYLARLYQGRWWVESYRRLSFALDVDYLAFTPDGPFYPTATVSRRTITLPIQNQIPPELSFLSASGYTQGTSPTAANLPLVKGNFGVNGGGIPTRNGTFLYDFALGISSKTFSNSYLNYWEHIAGTPGIQIYFSLFPREFPDTWFAQFGLMGFALGQIGGRWRLAQSLRSCHTLTQGGFSFPTPLDLNGPGMVVYRWGEDAVDDNGVPVVDFTTVDTYDFYQYDAVTKNWLRVQTPPDQTAFYRYYVGFETSGAGSILTPWTMTPPFATYRVRLRTSV